ncbi:hypothetical protein LPJ78_000655 [Coemansia sp. RSA 989]|nr:hypothetical protein BX667DRAFT_514354 [Coemansia mojavensis]KAJ1744139.1 hypothetical protein LPJ68_000369 [Coemansia sp. RSA 1086]KAJ1867783.1 hypothetical protein LPJ78_000655 [Coemansia sp. RSA 989]KAJ1870362.1 hypothetical protein LPJ55_004713 [Coemansia sp. RSA 990]KAJ2633727.1 hypothetical protein H4R22_000267 [Coemansia sp. RSA 1290]KAJ2651355.1 hypothetical protein IWW40_001846 [Coemansia sp. RSA 1250]KAJ2673664.1 hypothetical protein IWW42_002076 [Coemansia sp. RSA 1085]
MDRPASYVPSAQQQGPASVSSIQNILAFNRPSPQASLLPPPLLQQTRHHEPPQSPGLPAEPGSKGPPDDRPQITISEPDVANDDGAHHAAADPGSRRRSINSSKRAAQNRAAQRAFRLRRERYVAGLEEKARTFDRLEAAFMDIQRENYQLRASLHKLQSENAAMRAHLATGTPLSPPPSCVASAPFSPVAVMPHSAQTPLRQNALTDSAPHSHFTGAHHQLHQQKRPFQHIQQHPAQPEFAANVHGYPHAIPHAAPFQPPMPNAYPSHSQGDPHHHSVKRFQRDSSLPHSLDPYSPMPNAAPAPATASMIETAPSPRAPRDCGPAISTASPATEPLPPKQSTNLETASSSSTGAPMLPSVREITMSIGAMLPSGFRVDRSQPESLQDANLSSNRMDECAEAKRRPW